MQYDQHSIWRCLHAEGGISATDLVLEARAASPDNLSSCGTWVAKQQVSCLQKSSGSPQVTMYYREWILSNYVYDTQMERE